MIHLFLSQSDATAAGDDGPAKSMVSHLDQLGPIIWSAIVAAGCRSEARLWLCNTVSRLSSVSRRDQREIFVSLLRSKPEGPTLASRVLQLMFEKRPYRAGALLAKRSHLLEQFFKGNSRRITDWFSSFDSSGGSNHKKGAKALSQFAFVNRDICWEELEWRGKHGQSPAMVATKPHYFLDLDIQRTVENFVEYVPEFWSSNEFAESLRDGEILSVDSKYFLEQFVEFMYEEDARDVWEVVSDFLMEEPFSSLCQRLLIGLEESDFSVFLKLLSNSLRPIVESKKIGDSTNWLEVVIYEFRDFTSIGINRLLLVNAIISQGRQVLRIIQEEECREEKKKIGDIISEISEAAKVVKSFVPFLEKCQKMKTVETIRLIGLKSWVVHYRLSEECRSIDSWESLFASNRIKFRKSGKYSILEYGSEDDSGSELDDKTSGGIRRKKRDKKRKRRRRNYNYIENYDDLSDLDMPNEGHGLQSKAESWLLSTDGFTTSWTMADLPEHLANHCFSEWMKWTKAKLTGGA